MTNFVVLTGGPGAGKTAVLEMAKKRLNRNGVVLPEAASLIFNGGFWRLPSVSARMSAQRAIYHVQTELENLVREEQSWTFALCDRGTLDGLAYWPGDEASFWRNTGTTLTTELAKYSAVIHMRTPDGNGGYNYQNTLRTETPEQAHAIDVHIERIWSRHPQYFQVPNFANFIDKAAAALERIQGLAPGCCG